MRPGAVEGKRIGLQRGIVSQQKHCQLVNWKARGEP